MCRVKSDFSGEVEMIRGPEHSEIIERIDPTSVVGRKASHRTHGSEVEAGSSELFYEDVIGHHELFVGVRGEYLTALSGHFALEAQDADAGTDRLIFAASLVCDLTSVPSSTAKRSGHVLVVGVGAVASPEQ